MPTGNGVGRPDTLRSSGAESVGRESEDAIEVRLDPLDGLAAGPL